MSPIDARLEVLAAGLRCLAKLLTPEQAALATRAFWDEAAPLATAALSAAADEAASTEATCFIAALAPENRLGSLQP